MAEIALVRIALLEPTQHQPGKALLRYHQLLYKHGIHLRVKILCFLEVDGLFQGWL